MIPGRTRENYTGLVVGGALVIVLIRVYEADGFEFSLENLALGRGVRVFCLCKNHTFKFRKFYSKIQ